MQWAWVARVVLQGGDVGENDQGKVIKSSPMTASFKYGEADQTMREGGQ